MPATNH